MKILLLEDDLDLCRSIRDVLIKNGYTVDVCNDGETAILYALNEDCGYELAIVDRMLPVIDGLDGGADDYLVKPFHVRELMARIRALTRRSKDTQKTELLSYADLQFDRENRRLRCKGKELDLSAKETDLVYTLMKQPDTTFSREQLILTVWGIDSDIAPGNVDNYISFLRKRLKALGSSCVIKTIHGTGYRLENGDA